MKWIFQKGVTFENGTVYEHMVHKLFKKKWYKEEKNYDVTMKRTVTLRVKSKRKKSLSFQY